MTLRKLDDIWVQESLQRTVLRYPMLDLYEKGVEAEVNTKADAGQGTVKEMAVADN
jgi:hypothetical protein